MFAIVSLTDLGEVRGGSACVWTGLGAGAALGTVGGIAQSIGTSGKMTKGGWVPTKPRFLSGALITGGVGLIGGCALGAIGDGVSHLVGSKG